MHYMACDGKCSASNARIASSASRSAIVTGPESHTIQATKELSNDLQRLTHVKIPPHFIDMHSNVEVRTYFDQLCQ